MAPNNFISSKGKSDVHIALRRLGPSMARVAADTAGAFASAEAVPGTDWTVIPRLPDLGILRCSQKNVGEKHEMVCNLSVEKSEWDRLFGADGSEEFSVDAFCEMANCICGSLIADPAFTDEFGYLIPCVPCAGLGKTFADAGRFRCAFRLGGAWIHVSISVQAAAAVLSRDAVMVA